ncbi:MAG: hypothetical protein ACP5IL_01595 [Syntrophobacteraceae bacterium]
MKLGEVEQGWEAVVVAACSFAFNRDGDLGGFLRLAQAHGRKTRVACRSSRSKPNRLTGDCAGRVVISR